MHVAEADQAHLAGRRGRGGRGHGRGHVLMPVVEGPYPQHPEADQAHLAGERGRGGRGRVRRRYDTPLPPIEPVFDFIRTQVASLETMVDNKVETKVKAVVDPRFDALEHLIRNVTRN